MLQVTVFMKYNKLQYVLEVMYAITNVFYL